MFGEEAEPVELANAVDFGLVAGVCFIEVKQIFTDGTRLAMKPAHGQAIKD